MLRSAPLLLCLAMLSAPAGAGIEIAGNGVYSIGVVDAANAGTCGMWGAETGELHAAGKGLDVVFGGAASPISSYTSLHSFGGGTTYTTGAATDCAPLCQSAPPQFLSIVKDGVAVGVRTVWVVEEPFTTFELTQDVIVVGPVDGTQNESNTVIRETHTVKNLGPAPLRYGLRKLYDLQIGFDDGPMAASCEASPSACDRALAMTGTAVPNRLVPETIAFVDQAESMSCPDGQTPDAADGCGASTTYVVGLTVQPSSSLNPRPSPPHQLIVAGWPELFGECWDAPVVDRAVCGVGGFPDDDTAAALVYGPTPETARRLKAGAARSYTQYLAISASGCPAALAP